VRAFVQALEDWVITALARFNVVGEVRPGRVGVWVERKGPGFAREDKIAAVGVKLRHWVSFHGISLNVEPDLLAFFHDRLKVSLRDAGARHDLVDAVLTRDSNDILEITRRVANPVRANSAASSAEVRSSQTTLSTTSTVAALRAARRMAERIATHSASGRSSSTSMSTYASAAGSASTRKSPATVVIRGCGSASDATTCGNSNRIPAASGTASSTARSR